MPKNSLPQATSQATKSKESPAPQSASSLPTSGTTDLDAYVSIARIARPQGIKGEVVATILTDFPERFACGETLLVNNGSGKVKELVLEDFWFHQHRVVFKFEGIDTRDLAETLRNSLIQIPQSEVVDLEPGSYYEFDLAGCQVFDQSNNLIGTVSEIMSTGAVPLLVVTNTAGQSHLVPLAEEICPTIDIVNKRIVITPPAGLLDL